MIDLQGGPTGTEIYKTRYNDLLERISKLPPDIRQQIVGALSQEEMDEFRQDTTAWRILTQGLSEVSGNNQGNQISSGNVGDGVNTDPEDDAFNHIAMVAALKDTQASN
jgi:hypothetical protein